MMHGQPIIKMYLGVHMTYRIWISFTDFRKRKN